MLEYQLVITSYSIHYTKLYEYRASVSNIKFLRRGDNVVIMTTRKGVSSEMESMPCEKGEKLILKAYSDGTKVFFSYGTNENRALKNAGSHQVMLYSPTINIARDPRWGRNEECYSEDPFLVITSYSIHYTKLYETGLFPVNADIQDHSILLPDQRL